MAANLKVLGCCLIMLSVCCGCRIWRCNDVVATPTPVLSPSNYYVSPYLRELAPRRVVIVAPQSRQASFQSQQIFATALANQLRSYGVVEAVMAGSATACDINAIRRGHYNEFQLVQLARAYNADAVVYCDVTSVSAYVPLEASVSVAMVDARESIVLLAADGTWQLGDSLVAKAYQEHLSRTTSNSDFSHGLYSQSPSAFLTFVACEIAQFMGEQK